MMIEGVPGSTARDQSRAKTDKLGEMKHYGLHRHFTGSGSVLMFGGGIKKGFLYGETAAERPLLTTKNPITIRDLHATIFTAMGISPRDGLRRREAAVLRDRRRQGRAADRNCLRRQSVHGRIVRTTIESMLTPESRLRDFPSLADRAYLNTAAEGIPPPAVAESLAQYARDKQLGMDGRPLHAAQWEAAKVLVGEFYGLSPAEIGICSCSSEAYNLAAMALRLKPGDEVVINDLDFPAGATPWLQEGCPATVKVWRNRAGALRTPDLVPLLGPKTRLVTVSLVSFFNGFMVNLSRGDCGRSQELAGPTCRRCDASARPHSARPYRCRPHRQQHAQVDTVHAWRRPGRRSQSRAKEWTVPAGGWFHLEDAFGPNRFDRAVSKPGRPASRSACRTTRRYTPLGRHSITSRASASRRSIAPPGRSCWHVSMS